MPAAAGRPIFLPEFPLRWSDVWVLYRRELKAALRERAIVVNSVFLPIFLYPFILWLTISGMLLVEGVSERAVSRVALIGLPPAHAELRDTLAALPFLELRPVRGGVEEAGERVIAGELDAAVEFLPPAANAATLPANFRVRVVYDRSEDRSRRAEERVSDALGRYRERWLERVAAGLGVAPGDLEQFRVERRDVASGSERGAALLGELIPLMLVIMVALGCFYPAIDATAGERERSTWETLMTVAASRTSVVTAKYLYVATLGIVAGALNVAAMTASMGVIFGPILAERAGSVQFHIPLAAVPVMLVGAAALALFFAAAMMILASFARTFKDGQSMVTPVYWLALLPMILGSSQDQRLTPGLAAVPIANIAQMIRDAIRGHHAWPLIAETLLVTFVLVAACLWLARQVLRFEDHLLGAYDGSFWKFARERILPGRPARAGGAP